MYYFSIFFGKQNYNVIYVYFSFYISLNIQNKYYILNLDLMNILKTNAFLYDIAVYLSHHQKSKPFQLSHYVGSNPVNILHIMGRLISPPYSFSWDWNRPGLGSAIYSVCGFEQSHVRLWA